MLSYLQQKLYSEFMAKPYRPSLKHPNSFRLHFSVLTLYTTLSLILTWPLIAQITTHVPGIAQWAFDESTFIWNIWYLKHTLVDQLSSPLHTDLIWYPLGIDLVLYTYNFFHALIAQPLALAVNLPFGSNVALLLSTVLSGYGTFLLVRYLLVRIQAIGHTQKPEQATHYLSLSRLSSPAIIAGLFYAFASNRAIYAALGHYDMVTTQWIPFYALMLLRSLDGHLSASQRRKAAVLAGLFFAFNGLAEMITAVFLAIFTIIVVIIYLIPKTAQEKSLDHGASETSTYRQLPIANLYVLLSSLVIIGLVGFALWSPVLVPILHQFLTNDFSLKGWGEAIPLSTDLFGWFTPTVLHPIFGGNLITTLRQVQLRALEVDGTGFRDLNTVFLGWVSLALALFGAVAYRGKVRIWIWTCLVFGLFTLGPFLQINGRYQFDLDGVAATFPLPYILLHYLPIIKANRAPNRNSVVLMLGLAVLIGVGVNWLLRRVECRDRRFGALTLHFILSILMAGLILFEHLALPAPLSDARIPAVYAQIAADPRPVSVLQIPLGWRNSFTAWGPEQTQLQYFQTAHAKPMLGGNISRAPDFKLDYFQRIAYFQALTAVETGKPVAPDLMAAARAQAADLAYLYDVGYVLLYPPIPQRFPYIDHWQASWDFVKQTLPLEAKPFWTGNGIEAYQVVQPTGADQFMLDLGGVGTYPYRGEGWDIAETDTTYGVTATWATAPVSQIFVPLRQVNDQAIYTFTARVHPFAYPDSPTQTVQLRVNDRLLERHNLIGDWQSITWQMPGNMLNNGLNRFEFTWGYNATPRVVTPGDRTIGATGLTLPVDADLKGFAEGGFIALFDDKGQQIDAAAGRQGVNVTVLDPKNGAVLEKKGFDTTANQFESQALFTFLATIPTNSPVLIVSDGDATAHLNQAALDSLRQLGVDTTLDKLRGHYFAFVGVQGAGPGTAAVAIDSKEAFLRISLNRDQRPLAASVDWLKIEPSAK